MVFGKKCTICKADANTHRQELDNYHNVISDRWLCSTCATHEVMMDKVYGGFVDQ